MKNQIVIMYLSFVIFFSVSNLFASESDKEKTFNVSKGENLVVSLSNGNITINTWEKDQAYIIAKNVEKLFLNGAIIVKVVQRFYNTKEMDVSCL